MSSKEVRIQPATVPDAAWIVPLAPRLHDFGPPSWRSREVMDQAVARVVERALTSAPADAVVLAAVDAAGRGLGFVHVHTARDFFTGETHGHVSDLVVASEAEGRGVGRALMAAAEQWTRDRGYRLLSLNVFEENHRARELYDRLGYQPDTTKLVKVLR
jgi:GNAT superfamily N-acetyltransferase